MKKLFKTTIVIWSEYNTEDVELTDLAREATEGDSYCSKQECEQIEDPETDDEWDGTEFFNSDDEDTDEEDDEDDEDEEEIDEIEEDAGD